MSPKLKEVNKAIDDHVGLSNKVFSKVIPGKSVNVKT